MWKCDLDSATRNPRATNLKVTHIKDGHIKDKGNIVGVKPTLVNGNMHLLYNDSDEKLYYMIYSWEVGKSSNIRVLVEKVKMPTYATFVGSRTETNQGLTFFQGYIGATMTTMTTTAESFSRTKETAVILTTLDIESCLTSNTNTNSVEHE